MYTYQNLIDYLSSNEITINDSDSFLYALKVEKNSNNDNSSLYARHVLIDEKYLNKIEESLNNDEFIFIIRGKYVSEDFAGKFFSNLFDSIRSQKKLKLNTYSEYFHNYFSSDYFSKFMESLFGRYLYIDRNKFVKRIN